MLAGKNKTAVLHQACRLVVCPVSGGGLLHGAVERRIAVASAARRHLIVLRMLSPWAGLCNQKWIRSDKAVRI